MLKIMLWILGGVLACVLIGGVIICSPLGSALLKPLMQRYINAYSPIPLTIDALVLRPTHTYITMQNPNGISTSIHASYNPFTLKINARLALEADKAYGASLGLAQHAFSISANLTGYLLRDMQLTAISNIAHSHTILNASFTRHTLISLEASTANMQLESALKLLHLPPYLQGTLHLNATAKQDAQSTSSAYKPSLIHLLEQLHATIILNITNGSIDSALIDPMLMPLAHIFPSDDTFSLNLQATLIDSTLSHTLAISSASHTLETKGDTALSPMLSTQSSYTLRLSDIHSHALDMKQGTLMLEGSIQGGQSAQHIAFTTQARGYLQGYFINRASHNAKHTYNTSHAHNTPHTHNKQSLAYTKQSQHIPFSTHATLTLQKDAQEASLELQSPLISLTLHPFTITTPLQVPYTISIPNLQQLQFLTKMPLYGTFIAQGSAQRRIDHATQTPTYNILSHSMLGDIALLVQKNSISATLHNISLEALFAHLGYKPVLHASAQGSLTYDYNTHKGHLKATLTNASIHKDIASIIEQHTAAHMPSAFTSATLTSIIQGFMLTSAFHASQGDFLLEGRDIRTDLLHSYIDATLHTGIKRAFIIMRILGDAHSPQITISLSPSLQQRLQDVLRKSIPPKHLDKAQQLLRDIGILP